MSDNSEEPTISFQDLAVVISIIDYASKCGAFEGKDLSTIGQVRDRIQALLVFHTKENQEKLEISEENLSSDPEDSSTPPDKE